MTQEQKAKAYDEALKRAKNIYSASECKDILCTLETIFPELKESEDERIRKFLIDFIKICRWSEKEDQGWPSKEDCIVWLEKQGEHANFRNKIQVGDKVTRNEDGMLVNLSQLDRVAKKHNITGIGSKNAQGKLGEMIKDLKPADKVEPKFHEGEWITNGDYTWKIVEVDPLDYILQSQDGNIVDDTISHVDDQFHSFTIEDAKNGDVLASELCDSIILFSGIKDDNIDFYCDYDFSKIDIPGDRFAVNNGQHYGNVEDSKDFHPATKEQRDLLFSKMKEAGYEWDAEKKELKKIKFNPDDLIEESYQQKADDLIDMVTEKFTAWTKEDKERYISCLQRLGTGNPDQPETINSKWFKEHVYPQPKQEFKWDEEDNNYIDNCCLLIGAVDDTYDKIFKDNCIHYLQSLKERFGESL